MDGFIRTLNVSAKDKEEVKNLGAKWSKKERSWYVPEDVYSGLFCKWIPFNWNFERALNLDPIWGGQIDQLGACYAIQNYGLNLDQKEQALIHEDGHIRASAVSLGGLSSAELERALIDPHWHVRFAAVVISDSLNELQFERALTDCEDPLMLTNNIQLTLDTLKTIDSLL